MKRKINLIEHSSVNYLKQLRSDFENDIQKENDRMQSSIDWLYNTLKLLYIPISDDTHLLETSNPVDIFRSEEEDLIYIKGSVFSLKTMHTKHKNLENDKVSKESYKRNKKVVLLTKQSLETSFYTINNCKKFINIIDAELKKRRVK